MTPTRPWCILLIGLILTCSRASADDTAARAELVPTGTLRVAIAVGPTYSGIYAVKDAASGNYRGVTIDLSTALAKKLEVPITFVPYLGSGEIQEAAASDVWDVTFMPIDDERRKFVDFGASYHLLQSTYLVAPGSTIKTITDANAGGVRIVGVKGTATFRASNRASPNASHTALMGVDDTIAMMLAGKADAVALGRASLGGVVEKLPGARILDGGFLNSTTAAAVPKGKPEALAYVSTFVEDAKASGLVRRAFDAVGLGGEQVAPAGKKP